MSTADVDAFLDVDYTSKINAVERSVGCLAPTLRQESLLAVESRLAVQATSCTALVAAHFTPRAVREQGGGVTRNRPLRLGAGSQ